MYNREKKKKTLNVLTVNGVQYMKSAKIFKLNIYIYI